MSWKVEYAILLLLSTTIDYLSAIMIGSALSMVKKRLYLGVSLFSNFGLLFVFKYFNFFSQSVESVFNYFLIPIDPLTVKLLLPVGISFYTFQTVSYTIDVYRGRISPEKNFGIFALYVSFFPQLVAGPIERATNLLPQFYERHYFDYVRVTDGLKLMLWGFFKKVVVSERLAVVVNTVYNDPTEYRGIALIVATVFFAFQIYCDFSGYSDIAIGSAQVMGFRLMDNFKRPYFSRSISEFWSRWHISLSTWFKDYLYIPLGGNRVSVLRWCFNILVVFLVSGLWHGASWTFVIWGLFHGVLMVMESRLMPPIKNVSDSIGSKFVKKALCALQVVVTFGLVCFGWIFFRANSLEDAIYIVTNIFSGLSFNFKGIDIGADWNELFIAIGLILFMEFVHIIQSHVSIRSFLSDQSLVLRWSLYLAITLMIIFLGKSGQQFIYFQF